MSKAGSKENAPQKKGQSRQVRRAECSTQREAQSGSERGLEAASLSDANIDERTARKAWAWANLAIDFTGGIIGQLIEDVENQLASHQDSIEWYKREVEKNRSGQEWHQEQLAKTAQRLERLREMLAAAQALRDGE